MKPIVWTIAGSDSGGGAGIQADLHTFHNFKVHGCSVITAVTAQNSVGVDDVAYIPSKTIRAQLQALQSDLPTKVIKLGMLGKPSVIHTVAEFLKNYDGIVICDPVMIATAGASLSQSEAVNALIHAIFPYVDLLTPNIFEAEQITQRSLQTSEAMAQAAHDIIKLGPKSVFIKGGHNAGNYCSDYWTNGKESFWLTNHRQSNPNTHGTGCTLSAAIAANLALGHPLKDALVISKMYVTQGIYHATALGKGPGPVSHYYWHKSLMDFPTLTLASCTPSDKQHASIRSVTVESTLPAFPTCGDTPLGLYPIVDDSEWLKKLLPLGITTIQLRIKNKFGDALVNEIKRSIALAEQYQARLFINDHWELAIRYKAYGVHLGQDDLNSANIYSIQKAGLRLGISTHCYYEVARAHYFKPSYIAIGPIFPTTSKTMKFPPQGLEKLTYWQRTLSYPLVAIGGIGLNEFTSILKTGVSGIAMISAITQAAHPLIAATQFLQRLNSYYVKETYFST